MSKVDNTVSRYGRQRSHHIYTAEGEKRTTVSLHKNLAELLTLTLGYLPDSRERHRATTQWLQ